MTILSDAQRQVWAKVLAGAVLSASLLISAAGAADAAPRAKCRNNPENYSFFHGKCLSDQRIERLTGGE